MSGITVQLPQKALQAPDALLARLRDPVAILMVGGRAAANVIRGNFDRLERERPNKQGWKREHLWSQMRRSTQNPTPSGGGVAVSVNHVAAAQRYFGGDIHPVRGQFLTIPAREEAYGHRAREFSNLRFGYAPDEEGRARPALIQMDATTIRFGRVRKDGTRSVKTERVGGEAFFWLVRKVHQDPDPSVLPTEDELVNAVVPAVNSYLIRQDQRAGGGNS